MSRSRTAASRRRTARGRHLGRALAGPLASAALLAGCGLIPSTTPVEDPGVEHPLRIPPLAESRVEDDTRIFSLTAREGSSEFLPDVETPTWGFDGDYLGPTIRAERGERVAFEITNALPETTTVHWHGMHLPAAMDGGPFQAIAPGQTWEPEWTIDQPAATLWYHPHPHGATEQHVYNGLAGLFLVDDDAPSTLPDEYGVDDVPVVVQDKRIREDGHLMLANDGSEPGTLGSVVMANGTLGAYHEVSTDLVRLRLLNGSTARTYAFGFEDRTFELVATDGGLLPEAAELDEVRLSPGERAEILVALEPGETATLRSAEPDLGGVVTPFSMGGKDTFDVLELRAAEELTSSPEPTWEHTPSGLDEAEAEITRTFELADRHINERRMDMSRIDFAATVDATEIWEVRNRQPIPHNFHVHDVQFEVLSVDGDPPPPELSGRKDTIYLEPGTDYRLMMRFEHYTDPDLPYMYHCHMLMHEDEGMMGQFVVVEPGQQPGTPPPVPHGHH